MATIKKNILMITPFFHPNIGGVETHLSDLVAELSKNYQIFVHTYSPITTTNVKYNKFEKHKNLEIYRYPWFGKSLFHKLEKFPLFDFLYLTPYLFLRTFIWMLSNHQKINIIHSHGFNAAFCGLLLSKIFNKKHIISTHAIYDNINTSIILKFTLNNSDHILCLSKASAQQLISWGINESKISVYKYWINLNIFKPIQKKVEEFSVLFVGRLIEKKGIKILVNTAKLLPNIQFLFIGTGPLTNYLKNLKIKNIKFLGKIDNIDLPQYYSKYNIFCAPSMYEEGYGRVVMEAVACGTPVIASNRGGLPEALNSDVAILIKPTTINTLKKAILKMQKEYQEYQEKCRSYALLNFSTKNLNLITKYYKNN
jgi:glycosyltransferase involved in cell wall biosynthesis